MELRGSGRWRVRVFIDAASGLQTMDLEVDRFEQIEAALGKGSGKVRRVEILPRLGSRDERGNPIVH